MKAQFIRGKNPKDTLRIGVEAILWNADLTGADEPEIVYLYDEMNQYDKELFIILKHFTELGDEVKENEDKILYRTELGLILTENSDYGLGYFCHISSLPEIEKKLGRPIKTE